jgi:hypothetical protein
MNDPKSFYGVYRGVVKDNRDPQKQRRIKIVIPQTTGEETTDWAWPVEPSSIHTDVPTIGQGVWVTFIGGDPDYPIWLGSFGKNKGPNKQIFIKPLANSISLTGLTAHVITVKQSDGTTEVDLIATIMALANKVKTLESQVDTLKTTLATRTAGGHTHTNNG